MRETRWRQAAGLGGDGGSQGDDDGEPKET